MTSRAPFVFCSGRSKAEEFFGSNHQTKRKYRNHDFADRAYREGPQALFAHITKICSQTNSCESQKKGPTRKIRERSDLLFVEELVRGKHGDEQETQDELGELLPEERGLVAHHLGLALAGPVDRVGQHDEANHGVARGLNQDCQFASGVGVKRTGSSRFGGVIHGKSSPNTVSAVT